MGGGKSGNINSFESSNAMVSANCIRKICFVYYVRLPHSSNHWASNIARVAFTQIYIGNLLELHALGSALGVTQTRTVLCFTSSSRLFVRAMKAVGLAGVAICFEFRLCIRTIRRNWATIETVLVSSWFLWLGAINVIRILDVSVFQKHSWRMKVFSRNMINHTVK